MGLCWCGQEKGVTGKQKERWVGKGREAGQVPGRTLAFIWSDTESQFGVDEPVDQAYILAGPLWLLGQQQSEGGLGQNLGEQLGDDCNN